MVYGGPYHTPVWYGDRACNTAAGTNASAILRKGPEMAEGKTFFFHFTLFVLLRKNISIGARKSLFNMEFTQNDQ